MTAAETSSLSDRLAALVARSGGPALAAAPEPDDALLDRIEELADLTDGLRADLGGLRSDEDAQTVALGRLEQRLSSVEAQLDQLGQTLRAEFARLEVALGQRVEEAALALAETLLRPSE
jgi:hypothetical protein